MEKSRLWQLYAALSPRELRELDKFVRSPAFNQRPQVVRLAAYLHDCRSDNLLPDKAAAWRAAFPGLDYDDARLHNTVSLLLDVAEQYLLVRRYRRQPALAALHLAGEYRALGLPRHFELALRDAGERHRAEGYEHAEHYWFAFQLEQERYAFFAGQNRMAELNLQAISDHLDIFYLAQKLRQACFAVAHQTVAGKQYDHGLLSDALGAVERSGLADVPAIGVYYWCYRALTDPADEAAFRSFKKVLLEERRRFPPAETRDLLLLATNYCIRRLNAGERRYAREALELYRDGLRDDVMLLNGRMSRFTFGNIVTMAISEHALDWAEAFVHRYHRHLEARHRESAYAFNLARLEYERGRYAAALPLLQNAEYSDPLLHLLAKMLLIKLFYETDQYDTLLAQIDALQNFLQRHKELGYQRENFRQALRYLLRLVKLQPGDAQRRDALAVEIAATPALAERDWLLERLKDAD